MLLAGFSEKCSDPSVFIMSPVLNLCWSFSGTPPVTLPTLVTPVLAGHVAASWPKFFVQGAGVGSPWLPPALLCIPLQAKEQDSCAAQDKTMVTPRTPHSHPLWSSALLSSPQHQGWEPFCAGHSLSLL